MELEGACAEIGVEFAVEPSVVVDAVRGALSEVGWGKGGYEFDDWVVRPIAPEIGGEVYLNRETYEMNGVPLRPVHMTVRWGVETTLDAIVHYPGKRRKRFDWS